MADPDRVYAIGDIHGHLEKLRAAHASVQEDLVARPVASHAVVHIGDYVDRGPDNRGVIDFLLQGERAGSPWINLLGNHDRMFLKFLESRDGRDPILRSELYWLHSRLGGAFTLRSYGVNAPDGVSRQKGARLFEAARRAVPNDHVGFLRDLRLSHRWRGYFFAHAGVAPDTPLDEQSEDDLIWIRTRFHESQADHGAVIVHGHTPVEDVEDHGNRIAIDTGAGLGRRLSCVAFDHDGAVRVLGGARLR